MRPLRVLFATTELAGEAKAGGLADYARSLCEALVARGHDVRVVLPAYRGLPAGRPPAEPWQARLGGAPVELRVRQSGALQLWQLHCPERFDREGTPYADAHGEPWPDEPERWATLACAVARLADGADGFRPDVVHLNDWHTALAAGLLRRAPAPVPSLFTIHNLAYGGRFRRDAFERLRDAFELPGEWWSPEALEFHGDLSLVKAGIAFADAVVTVSPGYAQAILTPEGGEGLDGLLRSRADRLHGVLNGIDAAAWNPATDPLLARSYDAASLERKAENRIALQRETGLAELGDRPLVGMVTRLAPQKGVDLVLEALEGIVALPAQLVVLGAGDRGMADALRAAAARHPGTVAFREGMDEGLAHRIEGGADLFLMPSRHEPCGLNQLYSMRYGTLPVVRRTGGLADTVDASTGFSFDAPTATALLDALHEAADAWRDPARRRRMQTAGMARDDSWNGRMDAYLDLYRSLAS